jgi:hypothetical protein
MILDKPSCIYEATETNVMDDIFGVDGDGGYGYMGMGMG